MKKTICLILMILVLAFMCTLLVMDIINNGSIEIDDLLKYLLSMAAVVTGIIRIATIGSTSAKRRAVDYENAYKEELAGAFADEDKKKFRKKLLQAIACYNQDQYKTALKILKQLYEHCETHSDYRAVLLFTALAYTDIGMIQPAIDTYKTLLRYDGGNSKAWSNLGLLYKSNGEYDEAFQCFNRSLEFDRNNPYAYNNLAQLYITLQDYPNAITNGQKALEFKNNMYQAASALALAYYAMGNEEESRKFYHVAVMNGQSAENLNAALGKIKKEADFFATNK